MFQELVDRLILYGFRGHGLGPQSENYKETNVRLPGELGNNLRESKENGCPMTEKHRGFLTPGRVQKEASQ